VPPCVPPPREAGRPQRPGGGWRRAADRSGGSCQAPAPCSASSGGRMVAELLGMTSGATAASASARSPSEPAPRNGPAPLGCRTRAGSVHASPSVAASKTTSEEGNAAAPTEACPSTAKAKAVAALQKLFFEELAAGQDANGAAARALRRLTERCVEPPTPRCGGGSTSDEVSSVAAAASEREATSGLWPVPPMSPPPNLMSPSRRRPNSLLQQQRVSVRN